MYFITITSLIVILHVSVMQATCAKTFSLATVNTNETSKNQSGKSQTGLTNYTSSQANEQQQPRQQQREVANQTNHHDDLDILRLEYNKYKILSRLGLTGNPDQLGFGVDQAQLARVQKDYISVNKNITTPIGAVAANRRKRSLNCNQVKSNKDACCLETFYVNFTDIGWDKWILYPAGYNANYCRGQCDLSHARYYHSTLLSKFSSVIGLCCSPKQMAPLRLLYIDDDNKVHQKSIPDMVVEACDCA